MQTSVRERKCRCPSRDALSPAPLYVGLVGEGEFVAVLGEFSMSGTQAAQRQPPARAGLARKH